jgi:hypothetical protein
MWCSGQVLISGVLSVNERTLYIPSDICGAAFTVSWQDEGSSAALDRHFVAEGIPGSME